MRELATFARWETIGFLVAFFIAVLWKYLRTRNPFHQLLQGDRANGTTYLSPARILLLIVTTVVTARFATLLIQNPNVLPHLWSGYLWAVGGSQALYLLGKANAIILNRSIFSRWNGHRTHSEPERRVS